MNEPRRRSAVDLAGFFLLPWMGVVHAACAGPIGPRRVRWDGFPGPAATSAVDRVGARSGSDQRSEDRPAAIPAYVASILGGAVLAVAWLVPETGLSAWLGGIATMLLVYAVRARRAYLPLYCAGLVGHLVGFHWVYQTVRVFGGFGPPAAALVFAMFVVTGACNSCSSP